MNMITGLAVATGEKDRGLRWLARLSCWLLALVFLAAGFPKIQSPGDFSRIIAMYGLLPDSFVFPAALLLPLLELFTAGGLLFYRRWALLLAGAQILMFIAVLTYGIHLGLDIDCGCFGPDDPEHAAVSGLRRALFRDVLFLLPVTYGWWFFNRKTIQTGKEKR